MVYLRPLAHDEAELHRALRLRALHDAPDSFGETRSHAEAQPASYWEDLTRQVTGSGGQTMVLACEGDATVGTVYGLLDREHADRGRVGGMWVDPAWRGHGIGQALLRGVFAWARSRGFRRVGLWAPRHRPAAMGLYTGAGFRHTGERRPLPSNAALWIVAMEVEL
mgnify:CR=1 FL=1